MTKLTEKIVHLTLSAIDTRTEMKTTQSEIKDLKEQDERLLQEITAIKENMREIYTDLGGGTLSVTSKNAPVSSRRPIWTSSDSYTYKSVYCRKTMG